MSTHHHLGKKINKKKRQVPRKAVVAGVAEETRNPKILAVVVAVKNKVKKLKKVKEAAVPLNLKMKSNNNN